MEVNIKTCHITYVISCNFNPKGHNITIAFFLGHKLRWAYKRTKVNISKLDW